MKDYVVLAFLVVVCLVIVDIGQGQLYRRSNQRRLRNGELITIVTGRNRNNRNNGNSRNNRNNGNSRNNRNNGNSRNNRNNGNNNRRIILGTDRNQQRQTGGNRRTNVVAIVIRYPDVSNLIANLAATIISRLQRQDMMFFMAGVDTKDSRSTRAMKAMFTASGQKSMAIGQEERAKTAIAKEMAGQLNISPLEAANSIDDIMNQFGIEMQGLGTRDDNCDQFLDDLRCDPSSPYRTADGSCNNLKKPLWGRAFIPMRRFLQPVYDDQVSSPRTKGVNGGELPSAREISLMVHESDSDVSATVRITHMLMQWGQFLDHDITSTPSASGSEGADVGCCSDDVSDASFDRIDMSPEERDICFPIKIPQGDPRFGHRSCMSFVRSIRISNTNCNVAPAEQMNQITAYIDASSVYGSSDEESDSLRTFSGGLLKTSRDGLLPEDDQPSCLKTKRSDWCFKAGDTRVNEQMGLATLHTVWMREHNRMARELGDLNPRWNDEKIFQETRKIVGAKIQHITYSEWLPFLLKPDLRKQFDLRSLTQAHPRDPYNENVDASIRNAFATAAYRFGHSLIRTMFSQMDRGYQKMEELMLVSSFGNTSHLIENNGDGVNRYIRGLVSDNAGRADRFLTPMITQRLFEDGAGHSLDLAALNIQRGRDHGLPGYNQWRKWCNLPVARSFDGLPDHETTARRQLANVYDHVNDIDLFAGGMSEKVVTGTVVGPTFACILAHQFKALKQGDRFFYERDDEVTGFTHAQITAIKKTRWSQVLCENTDIDSMQPRAFIAIRDNNNNDRVSCDELKEFPLFSWSDDPEVREAGLREERERIKARRETQNRNDQPSGTSEWGPWSQFGECSDGKRWRDRVCQTTGNAQPRCVGPSSESQVCRSGGVDCSKSIYNVFSRFMCNNNK